MHLYKTGEGDSVKQMSNSEKTCCYNFAHTTGASEPDWFALDTQRRSPQPDPLIVFNESHTIWTMF